MREQTAYLGHLITAIINLTIARICDILSIRFFEPIHLTSGGYHMIEIKNGVLSLEGPKGSIPVKEDDEITLKLAMLFEGECEGLGSAKAAEKFGYTRQRYYQVLRQFLENGAKGLKGSKRGPKGNYRRTYEVVRQIIRYKFLDPKMSPDGIAQKLNQHGFPIAIRSVERVISDYGLQKKTPFVPAPDRADSD